MIVSVASCGQNVTFPQIFQICSVTTRMKATTKYFHVVLFNILYKMVLTFKLMDKAILRVVNLRVRESS